MKVRSKSPSSGEHIAILDRRKERVINSAVIVGIRVLMDSVDRSSLDGAVRAPEPMLFSDVKNLWHCEIPMMVVDEDGHRGLSIVAGTDQKKFWEKYCIFPHSFVKPSPDTDAEDKPVYEPELIVVTHNPEAPQGVTAVKLSGAEAIASSSDRVDRLTRLTRGLITKRLPQPSAPDPEEMKITQKPHLKRVV